MAGCVKGKRGDKVPIYLRKAFHREKNPAECKHNYPYSVFRMLTMHGH